jgi:hypothetical protein
VCLLLSTVNIFFASPRQVRPVLRIS